jgi:hypothetical protein
MPAKLGLFNITGFHEDDVQAFIQLLKKDGWIILARGKEADGEEFILAKEVIEDWIKQRSKR